jgi:hypothetical protein
MSTVIVAGLAFAAVVLGLVTAILSLVNQRRAKTTAEKVQSISVQVDGRLSTLLERQSQLLDALHQSGTPVPPVPPVPGALIRPAPARIFPRQRNSSAGTGRPKASGVKATSEASMPRLLHRTDSGKHIAWKKGDRSVNDHV